MNKSARRFLLLKKLWSTQAQLRIFFIALMAAGMVFAATDIAPAAQPVKPGQKQPPAAAPAAAADADDDEDFAPRPGAVPVPDDDDDDVVPPAAQAPAPAPSPARPPVPSHPASPAAAPVPQQPAASAGDQPPAAAPMPADAQPTAGTPPAPAQPQKPAAPARPMQPSGRAMTSGGGSSFFFDDADVFEVIQTIFGDVLRVNYIIDPQVKGRVNFRTTTPIPRDKILPIMEIILRLNGVGVVEESGLYRIIPLGNISREPAPIRFGKDPNSVELKGTALLQIVPLTYINSAEMMAILTPLLTQGGAIHDVPKRNMLIIADTDSNVRRLLQVVTLFDENSYKDASQPKIYVYPLQNSKADHVAKILQQVLLGTSGGSTTTSTTTRSITGSSATAATTRPGTPPAPQPSQQSSLSAQSEPVVSPATKIIADEVTNSLVIFASPGDYSLVLAAIKQIDTAPRQVMIEAIVAQVKLTDNLTFGLRWNLDINKVNWEIQPFNRPISVGGPLGFQGLGKLGAGSFGYFATDSKGNVRLQLQADAQIGNAKILSAPHILVADNREARISVGDQIPIATSTTTTPIASGTTATNTTTATIQYKDTGTILKVKPQINDSGVIALEISQEVSAPNKQSVLGTDQFSITKSEVTTNLVAQDGDTIVIGGLINETISHNNSGIPLLNKIPVLGYLFGSNTDENSRSELVILITPRVVRNQTEAKKMTSDYYDIFKNISKEIKHERLQKPGILKQEQPASEPAAPKTDAQPAK